MILLHGNSKDGHVYLNGKLLDYTKINNSILDPDDDTKSFSIATHDPNKNDFTWGYTGQGPTYLAMAILFELTDMETAFKNCIQFRNEVIANIKDDCFCVVIDENEYAETLSIDPFKPITERDVYVYREIYYETFKNSTIIPGIIPVGFDEKIKSECEKFGWTMEKYNMMHSIDYMQRTANFGLKRDGKISEKIIVKTIDGEEKTPIYDVLEFPELKCPIRTTDKT